MPHPPAQKETILSIAASDAFPHDRSLGPAARMQPQPCIVFADTALQKDIIGLLEADAIPMKIAHEAVLDDRAEPAIEENSRAAAAIQGHILFFVAIDDQVFQARAFEIVAADDWKHRGSLGLSFDHAIGIQWLIKGKRAAVLSGDAAHRGVESAGLAV